MIAGLLKDKIIILFSKTITSEYGGNKVEWIAKTSTRANVKIKSQPRTTENSEIFYPTSIEFKVRSYVDITERDRILWNKKFYRILSLVPNDELQELTIITELVNE